MRPCWFVPALVFRLSPSSRSAYSESVACVLFEAVKSVQGGYTTSFERLVRFLFAVVLFQKPYQDPRTGVTYSPTLESFDPSEDTHTRDSPAAPASFEQAAEEGQDGRSGDSCSSTAGMKTTGERTTGFVEPSRAATREKCERSFQRLRGKTAYLGLYREQTQCVVRFMLYVRQHVGSADCQGAMQAQDLLLEFLRAALRVTPSLLVSAGSKIAANAPPGTSAAVLIDSRGGLGRVEAGKRERVVSSSDGEDGVTAGRKEEGHPESVSAVSASLDRIEGQQCETNGLLSGEICRQQHPAQCGTSEGECEVCGAPVLHSPAFATFSQVSLEPFFRGCAAPQDFSSHPFFSEAEGGRSAGLEGASLFSVRVSGVFSALGLLTLVELAGAWIATVPRLKGSFHVYVEELLRCFGPSHHIALPQQNSLQTLPDDDAEFSASAACAVPILRPLLYILRQRCLSEETVPRKDATLYSAGELEACSAGARDVAATSPRETQTGSLSEFGFRLPTVTSPHRPTPLYSSLASSSVGASPPGELEFIAAVSLLLPCAFLRLLAITWRAVPNSFCAALGSAAFPNVFQQVLLPFLKPVRAKQSRISQGRTAECHPGSRSSLCCWRRSLLETYVDCCVTCVASLHAHSLPAQPGQVQVALRYVEGFDVYALRAVSQFLIESLICFSRSPSLTGRSLLRRPTRGECTYEAARDRAEGDGMGEATSPFVPHDSAGLGSLWKGSAAGLLLSQELTQFVKIQDSVLRERTFAEETSRSGSAMLLLLQQLEKLPDLFLAVASRIPRTTECMSSTCVHSGGAPASVDPEFLRCPCGLDNTTTEASGNLRLGASTPEGFPENTPLSEDGTFSLTATQTEELVCLYGTLVWLRAATGAGTGNSPYRRRLAQAVKHDASNAGAGSSGLRESVDVLRQRLGGLLVALTLWVARGFSAVAGQTADPGLPTADKRRWEDSASPANLAASVSLSEAGGRRRACEGLAAVLHLVQINVQCLANLASSFPVGARGPLPLPPVYLVQLILSLPMGNKEHAKRHVCYPLLSELAAGGATPKQEITLDAEPERSPVSRFLRSSRPSSPCSSPAAWHSHAPAAWGELCLRLFSAGTSIWRRQTPRTVSSAQDIFLEPEVLLSPLLRCTAHCLGDLSAPRRRAVSSVAETEPLAGSSEASGCFPVTSESNPLPQSGPLHASLQTTIQGLLCFVLPCLSAASRQARLHALELLWLCSDEVLAGASMPAASGEREALSAWAIKAEGPFSRKTFLSGPQNSGTGRINKQNNGATAAEAAGQAENTSCVPNRGPRESSELCRLARQQLSWLVDLETVPIGLDTERKIIALYDRLARGGCDLMQEAVHRSAFVEGSRHEDQPRERQTLSALADGKRLPPFADVLLSGGDGEDSSRDARVDSMCLPVSVLPIVECTIRTLIAHLSIKFSPLWEPAVQAILRIIEAAAGKATVVSNPVENATDVNSAGGKRLQLGRKERSRAAEEQLLVHCDKKAGEHEDLSATTRRPAASESVWQARQGIAVLRASWRIVTEQVERAVRELGSRKSEGPQDGHTKRGPGAAGKKDDSGGSTAAATGITSAVVKAGATTATSRGVTGSGDARAGEGVGSTSRNTVWREWKSQLDAVWEEETDPMSRHTSLLHIVEGIVKRFGSDAFLKHSNGDSSRRGGVLGKGVVSDSVAGAGTGTENRGPFNVLGEEEVPLVTGETGQRIKPERPAGEGVTRAVASSVSHIAESRQREGLARLVWLLRECVRVVDTLTNGNGTEELLLNVPDRRHGKVMRAEGLLEHCTSGGAGGSEGNCNEDAPAVGSELAGVLGNTALAIAGAPEMRIGLRTHQVSLVPRACDLLRAVTAFGTLDTRQLAFADTPPPTSTESDNVGGPFPGKGEDAALFGEAHEAHHLWQRLLSSCAQRLITVADATLQQLVIKVGGYEFSPQVPTRGAVVATVLANWSNRPSSSVSNWAGHCL